MPERRRVEAACREMAQAIGILRLALGRLEAALEAPHEAPGEARRRSSPRSHVTSLAEHRHQRRSGVPSKLDIDAELHAFVLARADRLTWRELADAVAASFPPARRLTASSLRRWLLRTHPDSPA
jgi:hypothetical protein